jgi:23S rRNA (uracil1939-C5)-methyltransferase
MARRPPRLAARGLRICTGGGVGEKVQHVHPPHDSAYEIACVPAGVRRRWQGGPEVLYASRMTPSMPEHNVQSAADLRRGMRLTLHIDDVAAGGAGVARLDGYVIFVTGGLPGDTVDARLEKKRANFGEATALAVLHPSPHRVAPVCKHADVCGGCSWLALDIGAQRDAKARLVGEQLERLGGQSGVAVLPTLASPRTFHYRNKMEYSFFAAEDGPVLGLHVRGRYDRVFSLEECFLASELSAQLARRVLELARRDGVSAYHQRRHTGVLRSLVTRESRATGEIALHLVAACRLPVFDRWVEPLRAVTERLSGVVLTVNDTPAGIATVGDQHLLWGRDTLIERLGGLEFELSVRAFFQVNPEQAEQLAEQVVRAAFLTGAERVLDLYCGTGTLALILSRNAREVIGVESAAEALADARRNAERNGVTNCRFLHGAVEDLPIESLAPVDVVVMDPPRAGVHARALARVIAIGAPRIVYVSCNPATLARDVALLTDAGYALGPVQPMDMFPHTAHVEVVAPLTRGAGETR